MQENKNVVEEALLQMKQVEEAIAENAKGILQSTMKEEISQLVKESLSEQEELDLDAEIDSDEEGDDADNEESTDMGLDMNMDIDMEVDSDEPIDLRGASDEEILKVFKAMGEEDGIIVKKDDDDIHLTDSNTDAEYLVKLGESEENEETMYEEEMVSNDDIDHVLQAIFANDSVGNKMGEQDMDDENDQDMDEVVYEIEFNEEDEEDDDDEDNDSEEIDESDDEDDSEEIDESDDQELDEMDEEDYDMHEAYNHKKSKKMSSVKPKGVGIGKGPKFDYKKGPFKGFDEDKKEGPKTMGTGKAKFSYEKGPNVDGKIKKVETTEGWGSKKHEYKRKSVDGVKKKTKDVDGHYKDYEKKEEATEAARTYGMGSKEGRGLRKGITPNRNYVYKNGVTKESLESEVGLLREKNDEYRKALNVFREKLNEVAIFNSNLAYATRLFTEHSTTKKEKINILRRFDGVETLKDSKNLYRQLKEELTKTESQSMNESVGNKIVNTPSTGSSTTLIESKTYENPQFMRIKDLISKLN